MYSFNDCTNDRQYDNLESFYTNINDTIKTIKNYGKDLIIMASIPASIANEKNFRIHMEDVHNTLRNISCENKIPFISVYNLFIDYCSNKGITIDSYFQMDCTLTMKDIKYCLN